jgi:cytochrome c peroxidase
MSERSKLLAGLGLLVALVAGGLGYIFTRPAWTEAELITLKTLWIGSLPPLAPDPSNQYGDDPAAAAFGKALFFDTRFSSNGEVACATCHLPEKGFQDGLPLAQGVGTTNRRAMPIAGTAYSPWMFWDGRKDSQWSQALGPLENPVEHGGSRTFYAHLIDEHYRAEYEAIFGKQPDISDRTRFPEAAGPVADESARAAWEAMSPADRETVNQIFVNMGKAIAAYERQIMPTASRFDIYVQAALEDDTKTMNATLSAEEVEGLRLFIGPANCTRCHNGPLFTDSSFHNTGVPTVESLPEDTGRAQGAQDVLADEFNCMSAYSDAEPDECDELNFMVAEGEELERAFKAPSLRNVTTRAPFMHAGQFTTLQTVLNHYNTAPASPSGHNELEPLNLSETQLNAIIAFLYTLNSEITMP